MSAAEQPAEVIQSCPKCRSEIEIRAVNVVLGDCWSCGADMKIAFGVEGGMALSPENLTEDELTAARAAGAKLEVRHSKTVDRDYLANVCPHCDRITGDFYLHDYWDLASPENTVAEKRLCPVCDLGREPVVRRRRKPRTAVSLQPAVQEQAAPAPIKVPELIHSPQRRQVWGTCATCRTPVCPIQSPDSRFYCSRCGQTRDFVPDT